MEGLHPDVAEVLLSEQDIRDIVTRMGAEITRDYEGRNPLIVAVLRGAVVFTADIMRAIKYLDTKIEDRDVLIVEDILDSGLTLSYLMRNLAARKPKSLEVAAFLVKDIPGKTPAVDPHYVGAHVPNEFIVGYGLDYAERYRNLPYIGILKPEVYS